jgi:hypothetical protein
MKPTLQTEIHPDAESLNAFAEQALAGQEREQIVAHLAACGRCRRIAFLAQSAASEWDAASQTALHPEPTLVRQVAPVAIRSWLRGWRIAWASAAAVAATAVVGLSLYLPRARPVSQVATGAAPAASQIGIQSAAAPHAPSNPPKPENALKIAPAAPRIAAAPKMRVPASPSFVPHSPDAEFSGAVGATSMQNPEQNGALASPGAPASAFSAQSHPYVQAQASAFVVSAGRGSSDGPLALQMAQRESARAQTVEQRDADRIVSSPAPNSPLPAAAVHGGFEIPGLASLAKRNAAAVGVALPGGLHAVSAASARHRTLAIDGTGTLYLSEDAGAHWEAIERQWIGRAVAVRLQAPWDGKISITESVKSESRGNAQFGAAGASVTAEKFEIVNDKGRIWVSTDGRSWVAQAN